jgi:hypothetical protein
MCSYTTAGGVMDVKLLDADPRFPGNDCVLTDLPAKLGVHTAAHVFVNGAAGVVVPGTFIAG